MLENAEVNEALEIVERAAFSDEEMRAYDKFWDNVSKQRTYEEEIKQKAEERVKEAEAKVEQQKIDATRKMKAKGYAVEDIAEITGLTIEQIEAL